MCGRPLEIKLRTRQSNVANTASVKKVASVIAHSDQQKSLRQHYSNTYGLLNGTCSDSGCSRALGTTLDSLRVPCRLSARPELPQWKETAMKIDLSGYEVVELTAEQASAASGGFMPMIIEENHLCPPHFPLPPHCRPPRGGDRLPA